MAAPFHFAHQIEFRPEESETALRSVPAAPGVLELRGADPAASPYLTRAADLRRRLRRLLSAPQPDSDAAPAALSRRLNLRDRVRSIAYTRTGSELESSLLLYAATRAAFGPELARRRLHLHPPAFLRLTLTGAFPRLYVTHRLSQRALPETFGPFRSRASAERYCEAVLDLFLLRRCHEDLQPFAEHPGCVYGEMHRCLMPCKGASSSGAPGHPTACSPARYAEEAEAVLAFLRTRGQSLLDAVAAQREAASAELDFERAATLHRQWEKVRSAALLADDLVAPVDQLRALVLQSAAPESDSPQPDREHAAVFLLQRGQWAGPARLSTLGIRAVREQTAVGSSLFAQPLMLAPVPLAAEPSAPSPETSLEPSPETHPPLSHSAPSSPMIPAEERLRAALHQLEAQTAEAPNLAELGDALALFRRWYYRPEKQRAGEVFLPDRSAAEESQWPLRRILNGAARVVLGPPTEAAPVDREKARELRRQRTRSSQSPATEAASIPATDATG